MNQCFPTNHSSKISKTGTLYFNEIYSSSFLIYKRKLHYVIKDIILPDKNINDYYLKNMK